jgi:hypothetical protein
LYILTWEHQILQAKYTSMIQLSYFNAGLYRKHKGAHGSVFDWGTMVQAGGSRVRFPMRSLDFSVDLTLTAAL